MKTYNLNIRTILTRCFFLSVLISSLISCKKNEEPSVPVGKPIPYSGQMLVSIDAALDRSPYKLFVAAWKRAGMDSLIKAAQPGPLTIFAPTDSAFTAAGYTLSTINSANKADLDTLLAFHIVQGIYADSILNTFAGSTSAPTLLTNPNPPASPINYSSYRYNSSNPYLYHLYISANNGFWINGKAVKTGNKNIAAYRALIYPVNQVLHRPVQDIMAIIQSDPRFSYLLESWHLNDSVYNNNYNYYYFEDTTLLGLNNRRPNCTLFAPTNDAFTKFLAGFYNKSQASVTPQDLKNYANRAGNSQVATFAFAPLDSLLVSCIVPGGNFPYGQSDQPVMVGINWFYNDLFYNTAALSGYQIHPAQYGVPEDIIDLKFLPNGNTVTIKRDTSNVSPPVNITQRDIVATNGVIQVIDGLLKN